jgi:thiamine-phosphate pyrophosphorylase
VTRKAATLLLIVEVADVERRPDVIASSLDAGVDAIQLRDRRVGGRALLAAAHRLRTLTSERGAALLVNDRLDVALAAGAEGVHFPAASFPIGTARRLLGPEAWIGRSTHSPSEAEAAAAEGADYVILGPIFATPSKLAFGPPLGLAALAATHACCPVLAIGGVTAATLPSLRGAGAHGVAVIRAILDAADPAAATRQLRTALAGR